MRKLTQVRERTLQIRKRCLSPKLGLFAQGLIRLERWFKLIPCKSRMAPPKDLAKQSRIRSALGVLSLSHKLDSSMQIQNGPSERHFCAKKYNFLALGILSPSTIILDIIQGTYFIKIDKEINRHPPWSQRMFAKRRRKPLVTMVLNLTSMQLTAVKYVT